MFAIHLRFIFDPKRELAEMTAPREAGDWSPTFPPLIAVILEPMSIREFISVSLATRDRSRIGVGMVCHCSGISFYIT